MRILPVFALAACLSPEKRTESAVISSSDDTGETSEGVVIDDTDSGSDVDADGDGYTAAEDCDDTDATIHPGAEDSVADGVDQDCDDVDGTDADGDGYADVAAGGNDCDDSDAAIHPDAADSSIDGVDQNCDDVDGPDADGDGFVDVAAGGDDCDDSRADTNPDADESGGLSSDRDCDGVVSNELSEADHIFLGEDGADYAGRGVAGVGDVDGDGRGDILIGAHGSDHGGSDAGVAYLILGSSLGSSDPVSLVDADMAFVGESADDFAGWSVAGAGDVDGDGADDLLIGAYGNDDGGSGAGAVYLLFGGELGSEPTRDLSEADHIFIGEAASDYAGRCVAGAGDVDDDGYDDFLIGAWGSDHAQSNAGSAYLLRGGPQGFSDTDLSSADVLLTGEEGSDYAGWSVAGAGDVDGDGTADLLIGAHLNDDGGSNAGKAYLVLGSGLTSEELDLADADHAFVGEESEDRAGWALSGAGDVDGDGYGDVLIGAHLNDDGGRNAGKAYLVLGSELNGDSLDLAEADHRFIGEAEYDDAGFSVAGAGDVDGDGRGDLLIGADGNDEGADGAGKSYLIIGSSLGTTSTLDLSEADYNFVGENEADATGESLAGAGDVNGDGRDDLLIGALYSDDAAIQAGKLYLILSHL